MNHQNTIFINKLPYSHLDAMAGWTTPLRMVQDYTSVAIGSGASAAASAARALVFPRPIRTPPATPDPDLTPEKASDYEQPRPRTRVSTLHLLLTPLTHLLVIWHQLAGRPISQRVDGCLVWEDDKQER